MKVKVKIDESRCIGSGSCIVMASKYFTLNDAGKAQIKGSVKGSGILLDVNNSDKEKLLNAARACPTQAIKIMNEHSEEIS